MKILYIFPSGRKERLAAIEQGEEVPTEMLYGLPYFRQHQACTTELIESENLAPARHSALARFLHFQNKYAAQLLKMGIPAEYFLGLISYINQFDLVIGVPDSTALAIAYLKKLGKIKVRLVYFAMGLASRLMTLKPQKRRWYPLVKRYYAGILKHCDKIVFLGKPEYDFFCKEFSTLAHKSLFIPFCVDTSFWKPIEIEKRREVLFVGNDMNRDFDLLIDIAQAMPEVAFTFVSKKINQQSIPVNVQLLAGDWRSNAITDEDMRRIYNESQLVILPLKNALQPSGQSVTLQAMACGVPVVISKTEGFWDPENFCDQEHLLMVNDQKVNTWTEKINMLCINPGLYKKLSESGLNLVKEKYNMQAFGKQLEYLIHTIA